MNVFKMNLKQKPKRIERVLKWNAVMHRIKTTRRLNVLINCRESSLFLSMRVTCFLQINFIITEHPRSHVQIEVTFKLFVRIKCKIQQRQIFGWRQCKHTSKEWKRKWKFEREREWKWQKSKQKKKIKHQDRQRFDPSWRIIYYNSLGSNFVHSHFCAVWNRWGRKFKQTEIGRRT